MKSYSCKLYLVLIKKIHMKIKSKPYRALKKIVSYLLGLILPFLFPLKRELSFLTALNNVNETPSFELCL